MNFRNWYRSYLTNNATTRCRSAASKRTLRCHLAVEVLEDRVVPATISVANVSLNEIGNVSPFIAAGSGSRELRAKVALALGDTFPGSKASKSRIGRDKDEFSVERFRLTKIHAFATKTGRRESGTTSHRVVAAT